MSSIKSKNTIPELLIRKALCKSGLKGYRIHNIKLPGKPDISYIRSKKAIFINGCFWHGCPICNNSIPKTNSKFWASKFNANKERDKKKISELTQMGFTSITIWECQIKKDMNSCIILVKKFLNRIND